MPLIGVGLVLLLAIGAVVLLVQDDAPERAVLPGDDEATESDGDVASLGTPAFRFTESSHELVRTWPGRIRIRHRRAAARAAAEARAALTDLYTEAFLDPANWQQGRYSEAFRSFTRKAREDAESRPALLTAGPRAGDRFEQIEPRSGRIATRILLDRRFAPTLLVSVVRFSAVASGTEAITFRSTGQFFFERVSGSWKIVSFHVTRRDIAQEAA
jgi:hypothetical protein